MRPTHIFLAALLAGCAAGPLKDGVETATPANDGEVSVQQLSANGSVRYELTDGVEFVQSKPFPENEFPVYPPDLLALNLAPHSVTVRLIVSESGDVSSVEPLAPDSSPHDSEFLSSVKRTCMAWKFTPLIRVTKGSHHTVELVGGSRVEYPGDAVHLPYHVDYAFEFAQVDGRATIQALPPPKR